MNKHFYFWRLSICYALSLLYCINSIHAQLPNGFISGKVQDGYVAPMGVIFSKDGRRMFVWEKRGIVWVSNWNGTTYIKQTTPVLDISAEVGDWRDFGFASICLDPNFDQNGLMYMFYAVDRHHLINFGTPQYSATTNTYYQATISRVTRYRINLGTTLIADYNSRKILLGETRTTGVPLLHESHAGGTILFGTDGTLLVSTGDNASYASADKGSASETYWQQALNDGIIRSAENVGSFRSQMINSLCGKILRIDPNTGDGIASNPHFDAANPRSPKSRMWALGFRNPFRMTLVPNSGSVNPADANPGQLLVGDVQWTAWEDQHMIDKGGLNAGWPLYEGLTEAGGYYGTNVRNQDEPGQPTFESLCVQPTTFDADPNPANRRLVHSRPIFDYRHGSNQTRVPWFNGTSPTALNVGVGGSPATGSMFGGNCAIGGVYYTGTVFGTMYQNSYFFADYGGNWIKNAEMHTSGNHWVHSFREFAPNGFTKGIVDMEQNPLDNSIFYININTGEVMKISNGGNQPPVAVISSDKVSGTSPLTINFRSNGSNDPEGGALTYLWEFGDGTNSALANPTHVFTSTDSRGFVVRLTVRDNGGLVDSKTLNISVNNTPPTVRITNPVNNSTYTLASATQLTLQSSVTDNDMTGMQYAWQVTLRHNNHEHREPIINATNPTVQISPVGCDGETYYYLIEVTVQDKGGLSARDSVKIYPDCNSANASISNLVATPQNNAVALTWINPTVTFDEVMVVAKASQGFLSNPSGTNDTADANFTGSGSAFEGGKVVYRGKGNSVTVTNLTGGTRYFFRVFTRVGTSWTGGIETSATPTSIAPQLGCLKASYFNNISLSGTPTVVRPESNINYDWATGSPVSGINADNFSVRWEGIIIPPTSGTYNFTITADDGVRFWVNNNLILDKWIDQAPTTYNISTVLTQNQNVPIRVEYYERGGGAVAILSWAIPGQNSQPIAFSPCSITTPPPTTGFDPNKCYYLTARSSNKVIEIANASLVNNAVIQQWTYTAGAKHQLWKIKDLGDGSYRFVNANSGRSLDVSGASTASGASVIQWDWHGGNNQRWILGRNTEGFYSIKAKHSNRNLGVRNNSLSNGARINQYTASTATSQQWRISEAACPAGVAPLVSPHILTASGYRDGKKAVISWVSNANQQADYFVVQKLGTFEPVFEKLDLINAQYSNDLQAINHYIVTDNDPSEGDNVYRIILYRENETTPQYSELISINFSQLIDFTIFPNPASDYVDIDMENIRYRQTKIRILDISGRVVRQESIGIAPIVHRMQLDGLQSGQYFIHIEADGRREVVKKMTIIR